ncbi:hypothetical protein AYI68_g3616 [Smittium mucronatum]|uniref:Uncharacterized protein n=1 Tax=Smittium mucronatum TaxID=133383 RepID=A0A1R0GZL4_9FUNG|nr:hypothetical protein AYI68_g3616 [Smittium mucronatum]
MTLQIIGSECGIIFQGYAPVDANSSVVYPLYFACHEKEGYCQDTAYFFGQVPDRYVAVRAPLSKSIQYRCYADI